MKPIILIFLINNISNIYNYRGIMILNKYKYKIAGFLIGKEGSYPIGTYLYAGNFYSFIGYNQFYSNSELASRKSNICLAPGKCIFRLSGTYDFKVYYDT